MRVLYHFPHSPFSRRVRLALALKGLEADLRDARAEPAAAAEMAERSPLRTVPVLVDGEAVLIDSLSILHYLDVAFPDPPLWPRDRALHARAQRLVALTDRALDALVDLGNRLHPLADHPAWPAVRDRALGSARAALEEVASVAASRAARPLVGPEWGAADLVALSAVRWVETLPSRAPQFAIAAQIVALGVSIPPALSAWAASHADRPEVASLYGV
jgi:glutathione S-transferase